MLDTPQFSVRFVGSIFVFLGYVGFFWRTFKSNPGNRLMECGSMTVIAFLAMIFVSQLAQAPTWLIFSWLTLVILLCFSTLFFVAQRVFQAIRQKRP